MSQLLHGTIAVACCKGKPCYADNAQKYWSISWKESCKEGKLGIGEVQCLTHSNLTLKYMRVIATYKLERTYCYSLDATKCLCCLNEKAC